MRFVPVVADTDIHEQRHRQLRTPSISFGSASSTAASSPAGTSSTSFVMHLQDQPAGELLRVEPALHDYHRQLDEVGRVPCIGALMAARSAPWRRPALPEDRKFNELLAVKTDR